MIEMRVFATLLTIYTYDDEDARKRLNFEEIEKFYEGMNFAGNFDIGIVFGNYIKDELLEILNTLSSEEEKLYRFLLSRIEGFRYYHANLTDYQCSYELIHTVLSDFLNANAGKENIELYINLSCGHKLGALALYLAVMDVIHTQNLYKYLDGREKKYLLVRPFHVEKGIIEYLPVMNFEYKEKRSWEKYLKMMEDSITLEDFKKLLKKEKPGRSNYGDKVIMYLKKHRYIEARGNLLYLTSRGKALVKLIEKIS